MTNEELKKELELMLEELKERLENTYALDFVEEHDSSEENYLTDAIAEFADNRTSVYYSEQREFYNDNTEDCDNALLEMMDAESMVNYIKEYGLDRLMCYAGSLGKYTAIENDLHDNENEIVKILAIKYALEHLEEITDAKKVWSKIDDLTAYDVQRFNDIEYIVALNEEDK